MKKVETCTKPLCFCFQNQLKTSISHHRCDQSPQHSDDPQMLGPPSLPNEGALNLINQVLAFHT